MADCCTEEATGDSAMAGSNEEVCETAAAGDDVDMVDASSSTAPFPAAVSRE